MNPSLNFWAPREASLSESERQSENRDAHRGHQPESSTARRRLVYDDPHRVAETTIPSSRNESTPKKVQTKTVSPGMDF